MRDERKGKKGIKTGKVGGRGLGRKGRREREKERGKGSEYFPIIYVENKRDIFVLFSRDAWIKLNMFLKR